MFCCVLVLGLAKAPAAWALNDAMQFSSGALIIPEQSAFQNPCGSVSAYGLVWRILQSNQPGHYNANHPVTVYIAINGNKLSPNRCSLSNLSTPPTPNGPGPSGAANHWDDPRWNDGCDAQIVNLGQQPVVPVQYTIPFPGTGIYPNAAIPTIDTTEAGYTYSSWYINPPVPVASPSLRQTVDLNNTVSPRFTTVQYMGGPFVIDAPDAQNVINFLQNGDSYVSASQLSTFTTRCTCNGTYGVYPTPTCHFVQMHQATANFISPVGRRMNKVPSKIALLDTGSGIQYYPHTTQPLRVLDGYLQNAGLYVSGTADHTDSGGCPAGTLSGCSINGGQPGLVYDQFNSWSDLVTRAGYPHGLLNATDANGNLIYKVFWTPHWDVSNSIAGRTYTGSDCTAAGQPQCQGSSNYTTDSPWPPVPDNRQNALDNVAYLLSQRSTGLMAECSAIQNYEGATGVTPVSTNTHFLFTGPVALNGVGGNFDGRNCTDPNYLSLSSPRPNCAVFQHVNSPFAQVGDFHYVSQGGFVSSFGQNPGGGGNYKPGVARLLFSWTDYSPSAVLTNPPSGSNGWDFFDFGFINNDVTKGSVIYVGGHEQIQSTVGNRLILNTLLNLDFAPSTSDRALSAPIAFVDNNPGTSDTDGTRSLLFAGTYQAVANEPTDPTFASFRYDVGSHWLYPYVTGNFRTHSLIGGNTLRAGESDLAQFTLWDAAPPLAQVGPSTRNVFTYFGGHVATGQPGPYGLRQIGWVPEMVAGTTLQSPCTATQCVDVMKLQNNGGQLVMVPGSDGICDLQQAVEITNIDPNGDLTGACGSTNTANLINDYPIVQSMLQVVRGYCFSTTTQSDGPVSANPPRLTPANNQCNGSTGSNGAALGGIAHSTPAVVPPSVNIDTGTNKRPTVAYVGDYGGQLHAIYVSGGANYTGPAIPVSLPVGNLPANSSRAGSPTGSVFQTNWATQFAAGTTPPAGTELWSFIPSSQLSGVRGNNARVDASPVYMDALIDVTGNGIREWHTVLVASIGPTGNEVLAMDISNPLKPVLMWDIVGSAFQWGPSYPQYPTVSLANTSIGGLWDIEWLNSGPSPALYRFAPTPDPGRAYTGRFDYSDLGSSIGISMGQMRNGLLPLYGVFVATNASGLTAGGLAKGLEVFAIDVATGQKVWQWEQAYSQSYVPNATPTVISLITGVDGVNRLYAGDQEGRVWELDATTGVNVANGNSVCASPPCNYPVFDAQSTAVSPQPITTNIAIAKVPQTPDPGSAFVNYPGHKLLLFGTAGANWVPASVSGNIHATFWDQADRVPYQTGGWNLAHTINWSARQAQDYASTYGILQEISPGLPHTFAPGERMYGAITISGVRAYFATANGPVPNDINLLNGRTTGASYYLDFQSANPTNPITTLPVPSYANYGGMTVFHNTITGEDYVIGLEVSKISKTVDNSGRSTANKALSVTGQGGQIYYLKSWIQRFFQ
jgi:type IV pilus assembly protein PilY1